LLLAVEVREAFKAMLLEAVALVVTERQHNFLFLLVWHLLLLLVGVALVAHLVVLIMELKVLILFLTQ
jgi:hypothetical protein